MHDYGRTMKQTQYFEKRPAIIKNLLEMIDSCHSLFPRGRNLACLRVKFRAGHSPLSWRDQIKRCTDPQTVAGRYPGCRNGTTHPQPSTPHGSWLEVDDGLGIASVAHNGACRSARRQVKKHLRKPWHGDRIARSPDSKRDDSPHSRCNFRDVGAVS